MALPLQPPIKPMLAAPVAEIPDDQGLSFEPKWDGYRCLAFVDPTAATAATLQSRTGKPLDRYFPEILDALATALTTPAVLDGELVVAREDEGGQRLDWDALSERIHPASSRIRALARETPARFIAFDLLGAGDETLLDTPFERRREGLVEMLPHGRGVHVTPATTDPQVARTWFDRFEGAGLDGIIGKSTTAPYAPGKRTMLKFKHTRTADCVVAGLRWHADTEPGTAVGSLLLGLYDEAEVLHHVGVAGAFSARHRRELARELAALREGGSEGHPWLGERAADGRRIPGTINRWRSREQPWEPLRPERVAEVTYDHTEGAHPARFRHTTQFVRWRPDRAPASCGYAQLAEPARYDLAAVLRGQ